MRREDGRCAYDLVLNTEELSNPLRLSLCGRSLFVATNAWAVESATLVRFDDWFGVHRERGSTCGRHPDLRLHQLGQAADLAGVLGRRVQRFVALELSAPGRGIDETVTPVDGLEYFACVVRSGTEAQDFDVSINSQAIE